jgi:exonuclease III
MRGRSGEVADMAQRRRLDFCCLQETRWKGGSTRKLGNYKFFWVGCEEGTAGVGILVEQRWTEKVLEVKRISERIIALRVIVGKTEH